jgi:1-acyl-sn-glycerol-3-phosphate acyltransferase
MIRLIFIFVFKITGWKVTGSVSEELKQYILAVGPHTSNWDFPIGVMMRSIARLKNAKFLGKDSLFKPPHGWLFRAMGGYPVDRRKSQDMTQQVADFFKLHEHFAIAIAPEGTRRKVERLRTGFYYIAKKAGIPIVPVGFDYSKKEVIFGKPIYPGKSIDKDMAKLMKFYKGITGKNPQWGL